MKTGGHFVPKWPSWGGGGGGGQSFFYGSTWVAGYGFWVLHRAQNGLRIGSACRFHVKPFLQVRGSILGSGVLPSRKLPIGSKRQSLKYEPMVEIVARFRPGDAQIPFRLVNPKETNHFGGDVTWLTMEGEQTFTSTKPQQAKCKLFPNNNHAQGNWVSNQPARECGRHFGATSDVAVNPPCIPLQHRRRHSQSWASFYFLATCPGKHGDPAFRVQGLAVYWPLARQLFESKAKG